MIYAGYDARWRLITSLRYVLHIYTKTASAKKAKLSVKH